jgi:hypothetical protein
MDAFLSFRRSRISGRDRFFGAVLEEELSGCLVRVVAPGAGAGIRCPAGFNFEHDFRIMAIEAQLPAVFHEQVFFLGLVGQVT